jgi:hypothetical protein
VDFNSSLDAKKIVLAARPSVFDLSINDAKIPLVHMRGADGALFMPVITWFPSRETKFPSDMIPALAPVVARMRMGDEPIGRGRIKSHGQ